MAVTIGFAGCIGGPASQVYVMSAANPSEQTTTTDGSSAVLLVETASLPAFLDNSNILLRRGPHALNSSSTGHWGERLSLGITQTLAADLAQKLSTYSVVLERPESPASLRLRVEVDSFDVYPDAHCELTARWVVVPKSGAVRAAVGRGVFVTPASPVNHAGDGEIVRAMAGAVAELADAIVSSM